MSDIRRPSGEQSFVSSFIAESKKQYKIKAHYGNVYRFVTVESHRTAKQLLKYYISLIHSGRPVYVYNIYNNNKEACVLKLNDADSFAVIAL